MKLLTITALKILYENNLYKIPNYMPSRSHLGTKRQSELERYHLGLCGLDEGGAGIRRSNSNLDFARINVMYQKEFCQIGQKRTSD